MTARSRPLTRSIAAPVLIAVAVASAFVTLRLVVLDDGDVTRFVVAGEAFTDRERAPDGLHVFPGFGYDGQFYYRLGLDPLNFDKRALGIEIDNVIGASPHPPWPRASSPRLRLCN